MGIDEAPRHGSHHGVIDEPIAAASIGVTRVRYADALAALKTKPGDGYIVGIHVKGSVAVDERRAFTGIDFDSFLLTKRAAVAVFATHPDLALGEGATAHENGVARTNDTRFNRVGECGAGRDFRAVRSI